MKLHWFASASAIILDAVSGSASASAAPSIPFSINALDFALPAVNATNNHGSTYSCPGPHAQRNYDEKCVGHCHYAHIPPGSAVAYHFETSRDYIVKVGDDGSEVIYVDITLRAASYSQKKQLQLEIWDGMDFGASNGGGDPDMGELGPIKRFNTPGKGYTVFQDITWRMVPLQPALTHRLWVGIDGNTNLCSLSIVPSLQSPSIPPLYSVVWGALDYFAASAHSPKHLGTCGDGPAAAQQTSDAICLQRDHSPCNIAFTKAEEYLEYEFYTNDWDDFDIWVRVATAVPNRKIRIELHPLGGPVQTKTLDVINDGWQDFHDVVWDLLFLDPNHYTLRVYFETGGVNLCSVAVKPSTSRYNLFVPGMYTALMYNDYIEHSAERRGDCPASGVWFGGPVPDAQITFDPVCNQALRETKVACNIGWTEPGEVLFYSFDLDGHHDLLNLSFRVASNSAKRRFQVTANGQSRTFSTPGTGWQEFKTVTWSNLSIGTNKYFEVRVAFIDGSVNLCAVGAMYADES